MTTPATSSAAPAATTAAPAATTNSAAPATGQPVAGTQNTPAAVTGTVGAPATTAASAAPETYADFTLPDGVTLDATVIDEVKAVAKQLNLSQEQAQSLVAAQAKLVQAGEASAQTAIAQEIEGWVNTTRADKEVGGANYDRSVQTAAAAITKFGTPALLSLMETTGLGKHPEIIRAFSRIGALMREDAPGGGNAPVNQATSIVDILYPKTT